MKIFTTRQGDGETQVVVCDRCESDHDFRVDDQTTAERCDGDIPCEYCGCVDATFTDQDFDDWNKYSDMLDEW